MVTFPQLVRAWRLLVPSLLPSLLGGIGDGATFDCVGGVASTVNWVSAHMRHGSTAVTLTAARVLMVMETEPGTVAVTVAVAVAQRSVGPQV